MTATKMAAPGSTKMLPRDAHVMQSILKDMGISDYEPRVINQMLEFSYRYVTDVLDDAKVYCTHAGKKNIDADDVRLAVQCKMDHAFTTPPPRDLLMELARQKNAQVLPLVKKFAGTRLPPDRYCLLSSNCKLKSKKPRLHLAASGLPGGHRSGQAMMPSLAPRKQNMAIPGNSHLSLVTVGVSRPTVTVVTKPAGSSSTIPTPTVQIKTSSLVQPSSVVTPKIVVQTTAKRKREDDDYDD